MNKKMMETKHDYLYSAEYIVYDLSITDLQKRLKKGKVFTSAYKASGYIGCKLKTVLDNCTYNTRIKGMDGKMYAVRIYKKYKNMSRKITEKEAMALLHYTTASALLLNLMEQLRNTNVYKHELKLRIKQTNALIDKEKDDILTLFDVCEEEFDALIENLTELTKPIIEGIKPEDWQMLAYVKKYLLENNTEAIQQINQIIIQQNKK